MFVRYGKPQVVECLGSGWRMGHTSAGQAAVDNIDSGTMSLASLASDAVTPGEDVVVLPGAEAVAADLAVAEAVAAESAAPRSSCSGEARAGGVGPSFLVTADWDFETREAVCWRHGLRVSHVSLRQETVGLN